jgi:hypothetical protein
MSTTREHELVQTWVKDSEGKLYAKWEIISNETGKKVDFKYRY